MQFTPLHDRVLVRRIEGEEKTKGGLIVPDTAKEKPSEGEVIAVGEGARKEAGELIPMAVKAGDRILFGKWSGTEVAHRRRGSPDHEGERHPRRHPRRQGGPESRLIASRLNRISETPRSTTDGRQAAEIRHRRA